MKRNKVLFFVHGGIGGAERVTVTYAKILARNNYDVKIVFICRHLNGLEQFVPDSIPTLHCKVINIFDFATLRIYNILRKEKPDAVFSSIYYLNLRVILAAKLAGIKNIVVRNDNSFASQIPFYQRLAKRIYPLAHKIVVQSREMGQELSEVLPALQNKIIHKPNPVDTDYINQCIEKVENPYRSDNVNYVFIGRVQPVKGVDILIQAFAKVKAIIPNSRLTIVGQICDENYKKHLCQLAESLSVADSIEFVGLKINPYIYIRYADCMVLTSRLEGNPNVVHEAMWLRRPVVVTRSIPIIDEIVTPDRGIVVDVDDIDATATAMCQAINFKNITPYDRLTDDAIYTSLFD